MTTLSPLARKLRRKYTRVYKYKHSGGGYRSIAQIKLHGPWTSMGDWAWTLEETSTMRDRLAEALAKIVEEEGGVP